MITIISKWPKLHRIWFWCALILFWIIGAATSYQNGNHEISRTDGATEQMLLHASRTYVEQGFTKYWLLPEYPPFGFDENGVNRTEPFVYTHYFPGPAWVLGGMKKIFGENGIWLTRLIPLTLNVVALGWLAIEFSIYASSSLLGLLLMTGVLTARSVTIFSVTFSGHGYVMGMYLLMFALLFRYVNRPENSKPSDIRKAALIGAFIGFFQIEMAIDFLSVTFLSAISFAIMMPGLNVKKAKNFLVGMVFGGTFGMLLQIALFSAHLGSLQAALGDFIKFGSWRMGIKHVQVGVVEDVRLAKVLNEYNKQAYGATGFTAYNMMILSALFILMAYLGKAKTKNESLRLFYGMVFAYLAAISWNVLMKQHSWIHIHFIPRHYFALFLNLLIIALPICKLLVERSSQAKLKAA